MSQPQDDLVARASDPNAELTTLHELANNYPGLRPYIAENPRTYPALLEWLGTLGDPAVDAALARRNASATTQAMNPAQARAAMQAAAAEPVGATAQPPATDPGTPLDAAKLTQAVPTGPDAGLTAQADAAAPTQALSQADVRRAVTPERRPIMEGHQAARDAAPPTGHTYQQPPQQTAYQQPAYQQAQPAYQQPAQPQVSYQHAQPAYQQPAQPPQRPAAGNQGVFGVGAPEPEERRSSSRWLWILGGIALVLVVALIVWYLSSDHGGSQSEPAETTQAAAPRTPATAPAQTTEANPSPTPTPSASLRLTAPAPDDAIEMSAFTTPSGNISCVLGDESVSCTIAEHDFVPTDSSCNNSNAQAFTASVGTDGEATGSCSVSFSATGASLSYGASAKNHAFACTSTESGIDCWSQVSGNGFRLSRSTADNTRR
ncbi:hypothetical protein [Actinomyces sp.]|uniref:variant leucine-rich repeat-containing protein n=1 Tax=Actinomyces sp. TaxID=29317 RepID=UPI0026DC2032|nr:hypothetical protein [Actinomyces sp.]MDO4900146.1 hypothetical protein [Actinomyces sp.]